MTREFTRVSADSHLEVPNYRWTDHVAAKYRDQAPKDVKLPNGADGSILGDLPPRENPMDLYGGKGRDLWQPFGQTYDSTPGTEIGRAHV